MSVLPCPRTVPPPCTLEDGEISKEQLSKDIVGAEDFKVQVLDAAKKPLIRYERLKSPAGSYYYSPGGKWKNKIKPGDKVTMVITIKKMKFELTMKVI